MPTSSVTALTSDKEEAPKEESPVTEEMRLEFVARLQAFIMGRTDDEAKRKEMLDVATEQFKGAPIHLINENCSKCHGRGFTGFNTNFVYYTMCGRCFKGII